MPNVSLCVQENEVHYNPYVDPCQQHDYVEIGGIKWATKNVGACDVTDTGLYFQWGDTQGYTAEQCGSGSEQKYFDWGDYKYSNNGGSTAADMTKYNSTDGKTVLEPSDDAVTAAWGGNWRMPTTAEFKALRSATTTAWTADYQGSGVSGLVLTDKTDESKTLFLPACGRCDSGYVINVNFNGYYWSSSLHDTNFRFAYQFDFTDYTSTDYYQGYRDYGYPVRGVLDE